MPSTQANGGQVYDYVTTEFDVTYVPPRCGEGQYEATLAASQKPNKDKMPMLVLAWQLTAVADGNQDNEQFAGTTVSDYLILRGEGDPKGRSHKVRLRQLLERLEMSYDLVPKKIERKSDLDELVSAINGAQLSIRVYIRHNDETGEDRENISYSKPRDEAAQASGGDDFDRKPAARKPAPAKKTASKGARR